MANELTISLSLKFVQGDLTVSRSKSGLRVNVAGVRHYDSVQTIGTSEEAIYIPTDVGVGGYMVLENLDSTDYITIRPATGVADLIKLLPGDMAMFRLTASAPFALANTTTCDMRVILIPL